MRRLPVIVVLLALIWASFSYLSLADEIPKRTIPSPYSEYGADTYSCLNIFKAVFPDTKPGEEEYYLDINWSSDPKHGYLSLPLSLPGYGKYTSEKLDLFMQKVGVPIEKDQYVLFNVQAPDYPLPCTYKRGLEGNKNWALIPPTEDYVTVMAATGRARIKELADSGIWNVNPRRQIPETGEAAAPGYLSRYFFYPPDLQVKDLKVAVSGGKATATATFYNAYIFGGTTDFHLYLVKKDGSKQLLKEQDAYIGPWGTFTLAAQFDATPDVVAVATSIARPWTGTEWGYGKFVTSEKINGEPLLNLAGYAVEMGNGAYPQEMLTLMENRWDNNVKQVLVEKPCTDISVVSPYRKPPGDRYVGFKTEIGATVKRANNGPSGPVQVRMTVTGPGGFNKVETFNLNRGESKKISYVVQVNRPGTAAFTFHAVPVGVEDCAPGNNRAAVSFAVKEKPNVPPPESKSWVELISSR